MSKKNTLYRHTIDIVNLAREHDCILPYHLLKKDSTSNQARRRHDVIIVLKALNLCERQGSNLVFSHSIIDCVYPQQTQLWGELDAIPESQTFETLFLNDTTYPPNAWQEFI